MKLATKGQPPTEKPVNKSTQLGRVGGAAPARQKFDGVGGQKSDKPPFFAQVTPCQVNNLTNASVI